MAGAEVEVEADQREMEVVVGVAAVEAVGVTQRRRMVVGAVEAGVEEEEVR